MTRDLFPSQPVRYVDANGARRHPRTLAEAFHTPPPRQTVLQGPYTRRRARFDPHRVIGWLCLLGFVLCLVFGVGA